MAATATRRSATKVADPVEPDEDEFEEMDEDEELEEVEETEETEEEVPKPKTKRSTAAAQKARAESAPKFGSAQLAAHITELTGETYDARGVRMLLRKLAKDGVLDRAVGETRDRYSFTGPNDPTVKAIVTMVKSGEAKALKQAGLDKVKADAAAKRAAKKAAAPVEEPEDEDGEDMEEVEEEAPAPKRRPAARKAAPAKAAPAKATATRRAAAK